MALAIFGEHPTRRPCCGAGKGERTVMQGYLESRCGRNDQENEAALGGAELACLVGGKKHVVRVYGVDSGSHMENRRIPWLEGIYTPPNKRRKEHFEENTRLEGKKMKHMKGGGDYARGKNLLALIPMDKPSVASPTGDKKGIKAKKRKFNSVLRINGVVISRSLRVLQVGQLVCGLQKGKNNR